MDSYDGIPRLGRPAFFNGQRLTAADLAAVQDYDRQLRWLHNRSLHQWGVVDGFETRVSDDRRSVTVQPGYALDCHGRDLVMSQAVTLPIPAVAGSRRYYLTIAYAEDEQLAAETRTGIGAGVGAVRRIEDVKVRWQDPSDTDQETGYLRGEDLVLATIDVQNCRLIGDISPVNRQSATPSQQPYIAFGQTTPGETVWKFWPDSDHPTGVMTKVATMGTGFHTAPQIYAHVVGERFFRAPNGDELQQFAVDGFINVANVTASDFELYVVLPFGMMGQTQQVKKISITSDDYETLIAIIVDSWAKRTGDTSNLEAINRLTLKWRRPEICVDDFLVNHESWKDLPGGTKVLGPDVVDTPLENVDLQAAYRYIAYSNNLENDALIVANELDWDTLCLRIGQELIIPVTVSLNPRNQVLQDSILDLLKENWHVVWMGVEG